MKTLDRVTWQKKAAGEKAAEYIKDGMIVGLGTGSTAFFAIKKVAELAAGGMDIRAVATSESTEKLAGELDIALYAIDACPRIDLAIDGVDEIDPGFNAIKGGGGALFREKVVAALAETVIWVMDESKLVHELGGFPLPVEVVPFGHIHVMDQFRAWGYRPVLRKKDGRTFVTDNGNYIVDLALPKSLDLGGLSARLKAMTGVVETGLFLNICRRIVVGTDEGVRVIENEQR